ncbi:hypothetical protein F5146DRAFT_1005552 [Armillaria mellea]|nr:hypothetical protein F5146DRAFT_1005552 [Armillaria mellea]
MKEAALPLNRCLVGQTKGDHISNLADVWWIWDYGSQGIPDSHRRQERHLNNVLNAPSRQQEQCLDDDKNSTVDTPPPPPLLRPAVWGPSLVPDRCKHANSKGPIRVQIENLSVTISSGDGFCNPGDLQLAVNSINSSNAPCLDHYCLSSGSLPFTNTGWSSEGGHCIGVDHSVSDTGSFKVHDWRVSVDAIKDGAETSPPCKALGCS